MRKVRMDVFNANGRFVHQDAHRQGQAAQRHDVDALMRQRKRQHGPHERKRNVDHDNQGAPPIAQKQQNHHPSQQRAQGAFQRQSRNGARHVRRLIKLIADLHIAGDHALEFGKILFHQVHHRERRGVRPFGDGDINRAPPIHQRITSDDVGAIRHLTHVAQEYRGISPGADGNGVEIFDVFHHGIERHHRIIFPNGHVAGRSDGVGGSYRSNDFVWRHVIGAQAVRFQIDDDAAGAPAERRRGRNPRQGREQWPDKVQGRILHFAHRARFAGEDQVADRDAAGIKTHDERRDRAGRHESAGTIDVGHRFGHRSGHLRSRMKLQLDDGRALDGLRFDVLDAGDVKEVILVIISEIALHLRRVHPAERLGDVNGRYSQGGKNVPRHLLQRQQ